MKTALILLSIVFAISTSKGNTNTSSIKKIKVMIVDTGIDSSVKEFKSFLSLENSSYDLIDIHGHGTHVTGTVLYGPNLNDKVCPEVEVYSCRYFYEDSKVTPADCFKKARELKIDIVNFSGGGDAYVLEEHLELRALTKHAKVIVSAGNNNRNLNEKPYYPASLTLKNFEVVGNGVSEKKRVLSSNYGLKTMLWRKGRFIISFGIGENKRVSMTGTSQATAVRTHEIIKEKCAH